ncbi:MAG: SDR family oxidoreductase [Bacilli bacterium]|nr:SDR family oxidoreductase [Bacilli bacterium]
MKALVTGASSGIGKDIAIALSEMGYDLILVARRKTKLEQLKKQLPGKTTTIVMDLSSTANCMKLYDKVKKEDIEVVVNNAGFGLFGEFDKTNLDKELDMIDTNIKAVHILTKLFLKDFKEKDSGYILNVASSAGFLSGPLMATYYATKGYVLKLTEAIYEELRRDGSNVYIGALCPGPVDTEFNKVAKVKFSIKPMTSEKVAEYAVDQMLKKKTIIIPGFKTKFVRLSGLLPRKLLLRLNYNVQKKKDD